MKVERVAAHVPVTENQSQSSSPANVAQIKEAPLQEEPLCLYIPMGKVVLNGFVERRGYLRVNDVDVITGWIPQAIMPILMEDVVRLIYAYVRGGGGRFILLSKGCSCMPILRVISTVASAYLRIELTM